MQIVIEIPKEMYKAFVQGSFGAKYNMYDLVGCVMNGTPLPKGHGDLKDVQDIINRINLNYNNHQSIDAYSLKDMIATVPTIIEADKEVSK